MTPQGVSLSAELGFLRLGSPLMLYFSDGEGQTCPGTLREVTLKIRPDDGTPRLQLSVDLSSPLRPPVQTWTHWPPPPVRRAEEPPPGGEQELVIIEPADLEPSELLELVTADVASTVSGSITTRTVTVPPIPEEPSVETDTELLEQADRSPSAMSAPLSSPWDAIPAGEPSQWTLRAEDGYDWSFDGGKTWGDMVPPFWQFQLRDGHTADACSDPTATFDSVGNAYVGGLLFDVASPANAFVVAKSNAGLGGACYHTPAALSFQEYRNTPLGAVANYIDPNIFNDKEYIVADAGAASPKKNNVYATWTRFSATNSPIYFSQSTNGGATWSPGIEISGANASACTVGSGSANPNACDQDQGSHPIVGPDGTIYLAFGNYNVPGFGVAQVLMVSCAAAAEGFMTKKVVPAGAMKLPEKVECHTCLGTGRLICKMCEGVGKILIEKHSSSEK